MPSATAEKPKDTAEPASPLTIRTALAEDAEQAWALQRAAFDLPETPPEHPGTAAEQRVACVDGRVVSCLTLLHARLCLNGSAFSMGGIRHVATAPDEQNRGYASALIRHTLRSLRKQGVATSVLFPFSFRYYRKFGYELGGNHCHFWCRPGCIPAYAERSECRTAAASDAPGLTRLHREQCARGGLTLERPESRWRTLCADPETRVVVHGSGQLDGFAILAEGRDTYGGRVLRVLDLAAGTRAAWRGLLGTLSQSSAESVEWWAPAPLLAESGLMRSPAPLREGFKPRGIATIRPLFQFRVVHLEEALRARAGSFGTDIGPLALGVRDETLPDNEAPVAVQSGELRTPRDVDPWMALDIRIFSQVFSGYMSPSEAVSQGLAQVSCPRATEAAEALFPAAEPFLSELDRF